MKRAILLTNKTDNIACMNLKYIVEITVETNKPKYATARDFPFTRENVQPPIFNGQDFVKVLDALDVERIPAFLTATLDPPPEQTVFIFVLGFTDSRNAVTSCTVTPFPP